MSDSRLEQFYVEGVRSRLRQSVERRMMSDVPFGVFLSGGIDSTTVVALMAELMSQPADTFTVGFSDYTHLNELDEARSVAKHFGARHREILISEQDMVGYISQLIHSQDEPIADWTCIPLYFVSQLARESGTTVVQVGEGSDEQFCGYSGYLKHLRLHDWFWKPFRVTPASVSLSGCESGACIRGCEQAGSSVLLPSPSALEHSPRASGTS